jgi:hypothetical protein
VSKAHHRRQSTPRNSSASMTFATSPLRRRQRRRAPQCKARLPSALSSSLTETCTDIADVLYASADEFDSGRGHRRARASRAHNGSRTPRLDWRLGHRFSLLEPLGVLDRKIPQYLKIYRDLRRRIEEGNLAPASAAARPEPSIQRHAHDVAARDPAPRERRAGLDAARTCRRSASRTTYALSAASRKRCLRRGDR